MARGKKAEKVLTPEEKLEQALVPVEEQPYPVPENWCWVQMRWVIESSKEKTEDFSIPDVKYIGLEHIEKDTGIIGYASTDGIKSLKNIFHPRQILYGKLRPYLNKHDIATFDGVCSTDILVFNSRKTALPQYINYYFNHRDFIEYTVANSKGINLPRVSEDTVLGALCPLPPLAEQQRIVERIESLFAKLDEAKEKVQAVVDGFETRKAAILHKAFAGELTAEWRKRHPIEFKVWEKRRLSQCCKIGSGGTPSRKHREYYKGTIPWVKTGEIDWNEIYNSEEHITEQAIVNSSTKLYAQGAVLVAMYGMGMTRGRAALLMTEAATNQAVCVLQPDKCLNNRFLYYFFMCNYWNVREKAIGGNQLNLSASIISKFEIPIPDISEQIEIVRILKNLLTKEQQAKGTAEAVLEQIEIMRKSILVRAFRGELETNNPFEESAVNIIRQMLSEN